MVEENYIEIYMPCKNGFFPKKIANINKKCIPARDESVAIFVPLPWKTAVATCSPERSPDMEKRPAPSDRENKANKEWGYYFASCQDEGVPRMALR